ncbi:hypothetical protein ACFP2T_43360 [Plantactinospora solaniradicis]|uniref:Transcriptional regulator n=1 Tax=Plantactinospora solaniradicis TaxID=1723736 RepID=A0ABW1KPB9_9ACTN
MAEDVAEKLPEVSPEDWKILREALYKLREAKGETWASAQVVVSSIEAGEPVPAPLPTGRAGLDAARTFAADIGAQMVRIDDLIQRVDDGLYPAENDD